MKTVRFAIEGVRCAGCADAITALLQAQAGVRAAAVSFAAREARVLFDPAAVSARELAAIVERAGYRVTDTEGTS